LSIRDKMEDVGGQGLVSYAMILVTIATACVGGLSLFGGALKTLFTLIKIP
jgi:Flp pilus assembly pilin Flp